MPDEEKKKKKAMLSKWIEVEKKKPSCCDEILFTDGKKIYFGWLETYEFGEELSFYNAYESEWPENITHWMELPKPPT